MLKGLTAEQIAMYRPGWMQPGWTPPGLNSTGPGDRLSSGLAVRPRYRGWGSPGRSKTSLRRGAGISVSLNSPKEKGSLCLKVRAFASGRLAVSEYVRRSPRKPKRLTTAVDWVAAEAASKFIPRLELQRRLVIGGRVRRLPAFTSWSTHAKDYVRDCGWMLERHTKGVPFFATFTIPANTKESRRVTSAGSGYLADRLTQWIRDRALNGEYVYVWEKQKRGAPHIHIMFRYTGAAPIATLYKQARAEWGKILADVSDDSGVNLLVSDRGHDCRKYPKKLHVNFKFMHDNMGPYMAKYASKAKSKEACISGWWPGRWWGISRSLRAEVEARRLSFVCAIECTSQSAAVYSTLCALGFSTFESMVCFPPAEVFRALVHSFVVVGRAAKRVGEALGELLFWGDLANLRRIESGYT